MDFDWRSRTRGVYHDQLPHWVAECGCYSVTIRCKGTLPKALVEQMREIADTARTIRPVGSRADDAHRRLFRILDHYLDQGYGYAPFDLPESRIDLHRSLGEYDHDGLRLSDWVIMPNHLHVITHPFRAASVECFRRAWINFKMRTTRICNTTLERKGSFWQAFWFDRWIRNADEQKRWRTYFRRNPVSAGLCREPEEWTGLRVVSQ